MEVPLKYALIAVLVVGVLSAVVTRFEFPQVQTKTTTVEHTINNDIIHTVTVTKIVKEPSGEQTTTSTTTSDQDATSVETQKQTAITYQAPQWHLSGSASETIALTGPVYGLQAERRIIGPFFAGVRVDSKGYGGVVVGFDF